MWTWLYTWMYIWILMPKPRLPCITQESRAVPKPLVWPEFFHKYSLNYRPVACTRRRIDHPQIQNRSTKTVTCLQFNRYQYNRYNWYQYRYYLLVTVLVWYKFLNQYRYRFQNDIGVLYFLAVIAALYAFMSVCLLVCLSVRPSTTSLKKFSKVIKC